MQHFQGQLRKFVLTLAVCVCTALPMLGQSHNIIPAPVLFKAEPGYFYFKPTSYILVHDMASFLDAVTFRDMNIRVHDLPLKTLKEEVFHDHFIDIRYDSTLDLPDGGYILHIEEEKISITGKNNGAVFYGLMTLLQMIETKFTGQFQVPCAKITDYPKFGYRGMHLDCARHFFTVDEVKKYIDHLALYKMNTFHWHLTDDQGWRIEIRRYPKLTEIGAWRDGSMIGHYRDQQFDTVRYGGYYTQEDVKEIVKYASRRNITVIPEIEMPGHCRAALAAYPELGCVADTTYTVAQGWGIFDDAFCPKPETFVFLQHVLDEVMALFPSEYIHIGGDEVEKTRWKKCSDCQQLIKDNGLKDEHGLQSYFIGQIDRYVSAQGRKIIGWDEIAEGGISPNATIMSWRGDEGAILAAKQGHYAIMTPGSHCYFDYYQGSPASEPLAIGGYIPLEKVYQFDPVPSSLNDAQAGYILGAQGNVWSEYLYTFKDVEYMVIPRMLALSEVLWSPDSVRNYDAFLQRVRYHFSILDKTSWRYSTTAFGYTAKVDPTQDFNGVQITIESWNDETGFDYVYAPMEELNTLFGGTYKRATYTGPFTIYTDHEIRIIDPDDKVKLNMRLYFNKATGKRTTLLTTPSSKYPGNGAFTLTDGMHGAVRPGWSGNEWLGFSGTDMTCVIDLGSADTISAVAAGFLSDKVSWIYPPSAMEVATSMNGKTFDRIGIIPVTDDGDPDIIAVYKFSPTVARYVKITAVNHGTIPSGSPGAGHKAWLFVDEVSVE